jgi:hypothetical protein
VSVKILLLKEVNVVKFSIGDKVKVIDFVTLNDIPEGGDKLLKGATGTVLKIDKTYIYPYEIKFDDEELNKIGCDFWVEEELEFTNKKRETWEGLCIDDDKVYILEWIHEQIKHKPWGTWRVDVSITEQEITEDGDIVDIY